MKRIMIQPKHFRFGLAWVGKPFSVTYSQLPEHNLEAAGTVIKVVWKGLSLSQQIDHTNNQLVRTNILDILGGEGDNYADYIKSFVNA